MKKELILRNFFLRGGEDELMEEKLILRKILKGKGGSCGGEVILRKNSRRSRVPHLYIEIFLKG